MFHMKYHTRYIGVLTLCFLLLLHPIPVSAIGQAQQASPLNQQPAIEAEFEGVHLEIDIATNVLKIFLNTQLMYTFKVATGKNKTHTPLGKFRIVTKVEKPWYLPKNIAGGDPKNPLGTRWLGLDVPYTSGYKYGIHGTNNPYSIGGHVTQGCIRLQNKQVEWLYQHIQIGTPVIIKDSSKTR
ncbi:L,D-transpeptidase [Bacillus horti]|uniref:L,D-TPase catalytic domain-containing protein n=1 Tax=Caldalkalibacillus horti TaxID=77523 RepID=A0ABT9W530_9BACI|nr:L,D-transpeptidase [Bacillus horti]MDQ0168182.1 hypothetical protein [Bacillus horti]